ncbi:MurR/RpiR family transcriptional regulator [Enterococcus italicus]|uniref:MurR/RpiR family transcriptional regulator n=1 Tax=Enterococcus italicus TaxID=246144 RepID=UPI002073AFFD|nr:MurR/RpiR family transcriptional regulator [Enterococcus italicus]MCM6881152.1 MurR/RpiR family transcriptional regulator [Enterococcus italicus]
MSFFGNIDFNQLSDTDRSIYHFMSSSSDRIPYMRVRDIANESHTSASSVMRFIRKLGYQSFTEFRTQFKAPTSQKSSLFGTLNLLKEENFPRDLDTKLTKVSEKLMSAENVIFFGIGASGTICEYAARRFAILGLNTYALVDPTYPIFAKLENTSESVIIVLSVTGRTTEMVEMVSGFCNKDDFFVVSITGDQSSTLAQMSDIVLDYKTVVHRIHQYEDLTSQLPSVFLVEALSENYRLSIEK